jgi:hypothetical protein
MKAARGELGLSGMSFTAIGRYASRLHLDPDATTTRRGFGCRGASEEEAPAPSLFLLPRAETGR